MEHNMSDSSIKKMRVLRDEFHFTPEQLARVVGGIGQYTRKETTTGGNEKTFGRAWENALVVLKEMTNDAFSQEIARLAQQYNVPMEMVPALSEALRKLLEEGKPAEDREEKYVEMKEVRDSTGRYGPSRELPQEPLGAWIEGR